MRPATPSCARQVDSLLKVHDDAGEFLNIPAIEQISSDPVRETDSEDLYTNAIGSRIPSTRLNESIEMKPEYIADDLEGELDQIPADLLQPSDKVGSLGRMAHYENPGSAWKRCLWHCSESI